MKYKAHTWKAVLKRFQTLPSEFRPMAKLIQRIVLSPYRSSLFPVASMFSLLIFSSETYYFKYDMLQIDFDPREGKFLFEFFEDPYRPTRWKKQCPTNEGYSAFIHFLKLKQWFPVQEIPRGS